MAATSAVLDETEDSTSKKPGKEILREEVLQGLKSLEMPTPQLFVSSLRAGLELGFSLLGIAFAITLAGDSLPRVARELLVANAYTIGFLFVVLGRSELFTEQTTLALLPILHRLAGLSALLRLWGVVFAGNLIGGAIFAAVAVWLGPRLGMIEPHAFTEAATEMTRHHAGVIVVSGILAGWLMGLLSWLVSAARDTISQVVVVWIITTVIGLFGLHHVMVASAEVLAGVFTDPALTLADFARVVLWATAGNALGGFFFAMLVTLSHSSEKE